MQPKYGLISKSKAAPGPAQRKLTPNIFGNELEEDNEEEMSGNQIAKANFQLRLNSSNKILEDDLSAYDYDGTYDSMKSEIQNEAKKKETIVASESLVSIFSIVMQAKL